MPIGAFFCLMFFLVIAWVIFSVVSIDNLVCGKKPFYKIILVIMILLFSGGYWASTSRSNLPFKYLGEKSITTIEGTQVVIIDGNPYNLTEHFKRIFDENTKIRVTRKERYADGLEWDNTYLFMTPVDSNGNTICDQISIKER